MKWKNHKNNGFERESKEQKFGCVKFATPMKHPSRSTSVQLLMSLWSENRVVWAGIEVEELMECMRSFRKRMYVK